MRPQGGHLFLRLTGMALLAWLGGALGKSLAYLGAYPEKYALVVFGLLGALVGLVLTPYIVLPPLNYIRRRIVELPAQTVWAGILGMTLGLMVSALLSVPLRLLPSPLSETLTLVAHLLLGYLGAFIFVARQNDLAAFMTTFRRLGQSATSGVPGQSPWVYVVDTSALIDGRIVDMARLGFLQGTLLVPRFILTELQGIADALDGDKRRRGRRGLDMLRELQSIPSVEVRITDMDVPDEREVDRKVIALAQRLGAQVLTTDYNLSQIARLHQVRVLNIHDLAKIMQPPVLPGERLTLSISQAGKGADQGVGFLPDGTMVVVEGGRDLIGSKAEVQITKVLQTTGGRIVFARPISSARSRS